MTSANLRRLLAVSGAGLALAPVLWLAVTRSPWLYFGHAEFVSYRLGSALKILYGEKSNLWPVQGIPSGIIDNIAAWGLWAFWKPSGAALLDFAIDYAALVYAAGFALFAGGLAIMAPRISRPSLAAVVVMSAYPFYVGSFLLVSAPEYWLFEVIYAAITAAFIVAIIERPTGAFSLSYRRSAAIGAWCAIGVTLKAPLLGVGGTLAILAAICHAETYRDFRILTASLLRRMAVTAIAFAISTWVILWIYFLFDGNHTTKNLWFMLHFFENPNKSAEYGGLVQALTAHHDFIWTVAIAAALLCALVVQFAWHRGPSGNRALTIIVVLSLVTEGYLYLISARPHDSSVTSFQTFLVFSGCVTFAALVPKYRRFGGGIAVTLIVLCVLANGWGLPRYIPPYGMMDAWASSYREAERQLIATGPRIWYIPTNADNVEAIEQSLLFHGNIGTVGMFATPLAVRLFGQVILVGDSGSLARVLSSPGNRRYAVVWSKVDAAHDTGARPELARLKTSPDAVLRTIKLVSERSISILMPETAAKHTPDGQ